jgi:hypothetical protein
VDAYSAGAHTGFEGSSTHLIACCGMCSFGVLEPITTANATTFASALMKIFLRFRFAHTVVLDKDSKFFGVFRESLDLLKINHHVLSGDNHDGMLVERLNRYLNKGLRIMSTSAIPSGSPLRLYCSSFTLGTHVQFPAPTFLAAWLPSAGNSPFQLTSRRTSTGNLPRAPRLSSPIRKASHFDSAPAERLLTY